MRSAASCIVILALGACTTVPAPHPDFGDPERGRVQRPFPLGAASPLAPRPDDPLPPLTLGNARHLAALRSPRARAARAAIEASFAEVDRARAAFFPTLSSQATWTFNSDQSTIDAGPFSNIEISPRDVRRASAAIHYTLFAFGRDQARLDAAAARRWTREIDSLRTRQALRRAVGLAWFRLHEARAQRQVVEDALAAATQQESDATDLVGVGRATPDAELTAKAERLLREQERLVSDAAIQSAQRALNALLVRQLDAPLELAPPPRAPSLSFDRQSLLQAAYRHSPTQLAFRSQRRELEERRRAVRREHLPELFSRLEGNWNDPATDTGLASNYAAIVGLTWTPWAGGARIAEAQRLQAEMVALRELENQARLDLETRIADLLSQIEVSIKSAQVAQRRVAATAENARILGERFRAGSATARERLLAEASKSAAAFDLVRERFRLQALHIELEFLIGLPISALPTTPEASPR